MVLRPGVSTLALLLGLCSPSFASDTWLRLNVGPDVNLVSDQPETPESEDEEVAISVAQNGASRAYGDISLAVTISGIKETDTVNVNSLPAGATWMPTSLGHGTIAWSGATEGDYHLNIEVLDGASAPLAQRDVDFTVFPDLVATMTQSDFEVTVDEPLTIAPTVSGVIPPGSVLWGSSTPLPEWIELDETTGVLSVDTSAAKSLEGISLAVVDQTDMDAASTEPFSVAVQGSCVWEAQQAAGGNSWVSVTYGDGLFVAVAADGSNPVMTSPDGVTWTARSAAEENDWLSVTYGNGTYVAVSASGDNQIMTSQDGMTWTSHPAPEANMWYSVTFGNGLFVAVATGGTHQIMTSPDGMTWTPRTAPENNGWYDIAYGSGKFVAVSAAGAHQIMTSVDGTTWEAHAAPVSSPWYSITYGNGKFVAVAVAGEQQMMTSPDGLAWTPYAAAEQNPWYSVAYGNDQFVAVAYAGTNQGTSSSNGSTWAPNPVAEQDGWRSIAFGDGLFVAVADHGTHQVMTSRCD